MAFQATESSCRRGRERRQTRPQHLPRPRQRPTISSILYSGINSVSLRMLVIGTYDSFLHPQHLKFLSFGGIHSRLWFWRKPGPNYATKAKRTGFRPPTSPCDALSSAHHMYLVETRKVEWGTRKQEGLEFIPGEPELWHWRWGRWLQPVSSGAPAQDADLG